MPAATDGRQFVARIAELSRRGVPPGSLRIPNRFYVSVRGGKLHADGCCTKLRDARTRAVTVDLTAAAADDFCAGCVTGPTLPQTRAYLDAACRATLAAARLDKVDAALATDPAVTWAHVAAAHVALAALADVTGTPGRFGPLEEYALPLRDRAAALHARLRAAADADVDPDHLVRGCRIDLLGVQAGGTGPAKSDPPTPERAGRADGPLPALFGGYQPAAGHDGLAVAAWRAWTARLKADGDVAAARAAALAAAVPAEGSTPRTVEQLPKGAAQLTHAPGTSPWQQLLAEFRHQLGCELAELVGLWERRYAEAAATEPPARVLVVDPFDRTTFASAGPAATVLTRLEQAGDPDKGIALLLAPGPVADWLLRYGVTGKTVSYGSTGVYEVTDAHPGDNTEVLTLAVQLLSPRTPRNWRDAQRDALTAARGILAPAG